MRRLSHSLLFRLMVLVLLALLPSLGLVLNNASEERRLASLQVEKDALQLAWSISNGYNELIEEGRQILFSLSQVPVMHDEDRTACRGYLSKIISTNHHFTNIVVANLEGTIICDATGTTTNQKIIFDGFPESIIATKAFSIGNYLFTPVINAPIIGLGYPLLDEAGDVEALLIATLDLLSLNQIFAEAAVPTGAI